MASSCPISLSVYQPFGGPAGSVRLSFRLSTRLVGSWSIQPLAAAPVIGRSARHFSARSSHLQLAASQPIDGSVCQPLLSHWQPVGQPIIPCLSTVTNDLPDPSVCSQSLGPTDRHSISQPPAKTSTAARAPPFHAAPSNFRIGSSRWHRLPFPGCGGGRDQSCLAEFAGNNQAC